MSLRCRPYRFAVRVLAASVLALAPAAARAERIEVPLPALVGEMDPGYGTLRREIEFTIPHIPTEVKWVELRLRGSSFPGSVLCYVWNDFIEADVPETVRIPTYFTAYIPTSAGEWVADAGPNPVGVFDRTFRFRRPLGADRDLSWDFLRGGRGALLLYAGASYTFYGCDPFMPPSKMEIEKAVLIVEGTFPELER
jgi:hypothetical protein